MSAALASAGRRLRAGECGSNEPLAGYTTWRVGGPARRLIAPADGDTLCAHLAALPPQEPVWWLGLGSNVLVRDGGLPGTVIWLGAGLDALCIEGRRIRAEAGVACGRLARAANRAGLAGLGFLAGIPGTVGGALALNAGAWGGETWQRLVAVETVDRFGVRRQRGPEAFRVGYRQVVGPPGEWFLAASWELPAADPQQLQDDTRQWLRQRNATQPVGRPTAGSVFRNPPGGSAGELIERAGLKGVACGGAYVSSRHANFIINEGDRAADIERLIEHVQAQVQAVHGVTLEREVHILGEASQ